MTTDTTAAVTPREPELSGQIVVAIGGSAGIGLETARRARAEGAEVILTGRNPDRLERAAAEVGARSTAAFDATDPAALDRFFDWPARPDRPRDGHGPRPVLRAPGRTRPRPGAPGLRRPSVAGRSRRPARRRPGAARRHAGVHGRHRRPQPRTGPVADRGGHRRAARPDRQPGGRGRADPGQPHRRRVRRHPAVGHAARRRPGRAPRAAPRHPAHQPGGRPGRHRQARRAPDDQHRAHRRDLRHRRRPAVGRRG